jgi:Fe-S-cluster containining protein
MSGSSASDTLEDPNAAHEFAKRKTTEHLRRSRNSEACAGLVATLNRRMEATFSHVKAEGAPAIACRAGCSFCCHIPVEIVAHEAIALYDYLQTRLPQDVKAAVTERLLANAEGIGAMTKEEHLATNVQCAFLIDEKCSVYESRPLACASHHSLDVSRCEDSYKHPEVPDGDAPGIPKIFELVAIDGAMKAGVLEALPAVKLNNETLELNTAVAALVRDPSSIARWGSGYWRRLVRK